MPKPIDFEAITASKIGGDIVSKTLDTLNSGQYSGSGSKKCSGSSGMSNTYDLSKSVLSSAYSPKGAVVSAKG